MNNGNTTPTPSKMTLMQILISGLITACFMAYLAIPSTILACVNIALFVLCAYKLCRGKGEFAVIAVVTAILFLLFSVSATAQIISLVASAAAGGVMLFGNKKSRAVYVGFSAAVYVLALIFTGSPIAALAVFGSLPAAVALAVSSAKKATRVSAICATSAMFLITALIPVAASVYAEFGTDIKAFTEASRQSFTNGVTETFNQMMAQMGEEYANDVSTALLESTSELVFMLMPAMYVIASNIIAFAASFVHIAIRRGLGHLPEKQEIVFKLSSVSAWIYIISFVLMFFSFGDSRAMQIFAVAMENINLILSPAFILVGLFSLIATARIGGGKLSAFKIVITVLAFIYCGAFLFYPLAAFGVITTLKLNKKPRGMGNA